MNKFTDKELNRRAFLHLGSHVLAASAIALTAGTSVMADAPITGGNFHIDPDDFRKVLKIGVGHGADFSELFMEQRIDRTIGLKDGKISTSEKTTTEDAIVRLIKNGEVAYQRANGLNPGNLRQAARTARGQLPRASKHVEIPDFNRKPEHFRGAILAVKPIEKIHESACHEVLHDINRHAGDTSNLIKDVSLVYRDVARWILLCNSRGLFRIDYQPLISLSMEVTAKSGTHQYSAHRTLAYRAGFELFQSSTPRITARLAAEESVEMLCAEPIAPGRYSVILESGAGGPLFEDVLNRHLRGDLVLNRTSPWSGSIGKPVAAPELTLVDDGRYPRVAGTSHIDDEGTMTGKTTLIDKGILKGFLTDQLTADRLRLPLTGNSRRTPRGELLRIYPTNTHILPGKNEPAEILADTARGIYIRGVAPGRADSGQWVYPITSAFMIQDGALTHPVKNMALVCGATDFLNKIDRIGNNFDMFPVPGSIAGGVPRAFGHPTLRIRSLSVRKI